MSLGIRSFRVIQPKEEVTLRTLIDYPGPYESRKVWQEFLVEIQALPPSPERDEAIQHAQGWIGKMPPDPPAAEPDLV